jgi:Derlin-2/3
MSPEEWIASIPWVTKRIFFIIMGTTLLVTFDLIAPLQIALFPPLIFQQFQIWRLITSYFFFGQLSLPFLFGMGLLLQYGRSFEGEYYAGSGRNRMNFLWTLFLGWTILTPIFLFIFPSYFPGPVMVSFVGYLWSRRDPFQPINVYGFTLKAWHTPLVFIFFDLLMQNPILPTFIAIFVGHFIHVMQNMVPVRYGYAPLQCPEFLLTFGDKFLVDETPVNSFEASPVPQRPPQGSAWRQGVGRRF